MQGKPSRRIAALDGIRALCILIVLFAHATGTGIPMTRFSTVAGDLGVRGFFVLSGLLITGLLLRDAERPIGQALRDFYVRRALRIFPAFYFFLAGVFVLSLLGLVVWNGHDALFAATYTMNFHGNRVWTVGHLWSLAVEEQFYFLWPAALLLLRVRRATVLLWAAVVLAPCVRLAVWYRWPEQRALADQAFPCVFDSLATGCLLAIGRDALERDPRYMRLISAAWFWVLPLGCIAALAVTRPEFQLGIGPTIANVGIALALHRVLLRPGAVTAFLETPVMVRIGVLSYSIYLWQQVFVNRHAVLWWNKFPVNVVLAFAAGTLSYTLVEKPFLRLTARFR
jgi:peptidoglycan/LPS O-acetylase OafA/YrhL